jgi:WD40 repeat protein
MRRLIFCLTSLALVALFLTAATGRSQPANASPAPEPSSSGPRQVKVERWVLDWVLSRSPLDRLDPGRVPSDKRVAGFGDDLVAVFGSSLGRAGMEIKCVAYSPDGKWVASTRWFGRDGLVIRDSVTLRIAAVLPDSGSASILAFSPDGKQLATAGLAFSPDRKQLFAGGSELRLWEIGADGIRPRARLEWENVSVKALTFGQGGRTLAVALERMTFFRLPFGGNASWVQLLDVSGDTPRPEQVFETENKSLHALTVSPDGRTLAAVGDAVVQLWDLHPAKPADGGTQTVWFLGGAAAVLAVSLFGYWMWGRRLGLHRKRLIAVAVRCCVILLLGLAIVGGISIERVRGPKGSPKGSNAGSADAVAFSRDGRMLATGSAESGVKLWDVSGLTIRQKTVLHGDTDKIRWLAFAGRSNNGDRAVWLWNLRSEPPGERVVLRGPGGSIDSVALSPDGQTLVTAGQDDPMRLWDIGRKIPQEKLLDPSQALFIRSMAFATDGRTLALGYGDRTVRLWDLGGQIPRERLVIRGLTDAARCLAFSPDGRTLAMSHADGRVGLWDLSEDMAKERTVLLGPCKKEKRDGFEPFYWAPVLRYSPDGTMLLAAGEGLRLWDVNGPTPRELALPDDTPPRQVIFSPDGRTMAAGWFDLRREDLPGEIRLWERDGDQVRERGVLGGKGQACRFSADGRTLWTVQYPAPKLVQLDGNSKPPQGPGTVQLWDWKRNKLLEQLPLEGEVYDWFDCSDGGFAPDGRTIVNSPHLDNLVVWSAANWKKSHEYRLPGDTFHCAVPFAFAPDSRHVAVNPNNGMVYLLRLRNLDEPGRSLASCDQTLRRTANDVTARLQRGRLYLEQYRRQLTGSPSFTEPPPAQLSPEQALADLTAAIRLEPSSAQARLLRATCYLLGNQCGAAATDLDEAVRLDPGCAPAYYLRGLIHAFRKEGGPAVTDFTAVIRLEPANAQAYYQRGLARAYQGDYVQAKADLDKAVELDPEIDHE